MIGGFLVDTSAFARFVIPTVGERVTQLVADGFVAVCGVLRLEMGFAMRDPADHRRLQSVLAQLPEEPILPDDWNRAAQVQAALVRRSEHRGARLPDLVLAAVAERSGRSVLHYDSDYDVIARVTGQPVRWVAPRGTL